MKRPIHQQQKEKVVSKTNKSKQQPKCKTDQGFMHADDEPLTLSSALSSLESDPYSTSPLMPASARTAFTQSVGIVFRSLVLPLTKACFTHALATKGIHELHRDGAPQVRHYSNRYPGTRSIDSIYFLSTTVRGRRHLFVSPADIHCFAVC